MLKFRKNCGHTVLLFYVGQASGWASKICPRVELLSLILEYCVKFLIKTKTKNNQTHTRHSHTKTKQTKMSTMKNRQNVTFPQRTEQKGRIKSKQMNNKKTTSNKKK